MITCLIIHKARCSGIIRKIGVMGVGTHWDLITWAHLDSIGFILVPLGLTRFHLVFLGLTLLHSVVLGIT